VETAKEKKITLNTSSGWGFDEILTYPYMYAWVVDRKLCLAGSRGARASVPHEALFYFVCCRKPALLLQ